MTYSGYLGTGGGVPFPVIFKVAYLTFPTVYLYLVGASSLVFLRHFRTYFLMQQETILFRRLLILTLLFSVMLLNPWSKKSCCRVRITLRYT